ncbi:MAG: NTP transferase domain-containing protein [Bacteroidaceae bacterium]|nr:NTP transferase domain-containing protein [Bacteroidaceae bacterium]
MKFAIISAGEGSRLAQEGVELPKPLVKVCGEAMIDRLIRIFTQCGADEIVVVVNNLTPLAKQHLDSLSTKVPLRVIVRTTPSSMHSFYELSRYLRDDKFCLTTVDTIFREDDFRCFIDEFRQSTDDGLMGVTDYIDDEKPLYISTDKADMITGFHDSVADYEASPVAQTSECRFISGGIYCLTPRAIDTLERCIASGQSRMRNFQRALVADGLRLKAHKFSKILDVDHASDIVKAEQFLNSLS